LFNGLSKLSQSQETWYLIAKSGCFPIQSDTHFQKECLKFFDVLSSFILNDKGIQTVFYVFASRALDQYESDQLVTGFSEQAKKLGAIGKKLVFIIDNPRISDDPVRCVQTRPIERFGIGGNNKCSISRETHENDLRGMRYITERLKAIAPNVLVYDPIDLLCNKSTCNVNFDGNVLYNYTDHLSEYGSAIVARNIRKKLGIGSP
jgi:hypothetical protein